MISSPWARGTSRKRSGPAGGRWPGDVVADGGGGRRPRGGAGGAAGPDGCRGGGESQFRLFADDAGLDVVQAMYLDLTG
ncbi:hypothetical protein, partial [Streptomyces sp. NPDC089915]|uniref:hypothetical protein n=1 Tax=Streptomyces sp. NPDC089915 TaxID=3155186 RepID=UPI0034483404